jgi:hypothetical protein
VTGTSEDGTSIYQFPGDFSTNQLFLGPVGATNTSADVSHGIILSRALTTGSISNGTCVLYDVDGDLGNPGSIQVYDIGAGPLPWTNAPTYQGAQIAIAGLTAEQLGGNPFPGLTQGPGPTHYIYGSTFRSSPGSAPFVTITDSTGSNILWLSTTNNPPTGDWFYQPSSAVLNTVGPITPGSGIEGTSAVSPDGNYLVTGSIDNYFIVAPLTNGIPNTSAIFTVANTSYTGNGRGIAWDAADNILFSSSGLGLVQAWSLGVTATAVTTGNASGTTGFSLVQPSTTVSVVATTPLATQGGFNGALGTPVNGVFTITRTSTSGFASPQLVNYKLSGTAVAGASGAYTVLSTNSVIIPAGQSNVTVVITPTTNNVPRLTSTVILSLAGGAGYSVLAPFSDTVTIQNTSSQEIQLAPVASSMYKAFSNDFASFSLTRLGDTNAPSYQVPSTSYTYFGTAVAGTDFALPTNITFNPGDLVYTNIIMPLVKGAPPVDTTNPTYIGNLTAIIGLTAGPGFIAATNTAVLTSIDNADPPTRLLWSTPLTDPNEASNWVVTYGSGNMLNDGTNGEYEVNFGYDLTANNPDYGFNGQANGEIGFPPSGASNCLRITVNKAAATVGAMGGVNAFPVTGTNFSGNYAVRFYMNDVQGADENVATEGPLFGINHAKLGYATNWFAGEGLTSVLPGLTNWVSDGIWYWMDGQAGGEADGDYVEFTSISNTFPNSGFQILAGAIGATFANNFKYPAPFNTYPAYDVTGIPANESANAVALLNPGFLPASTWADVEIKQINKVVTLSIDKIPIFTYTNTTIWTNGVPMLGYEDPFPSVQSEDGAAFFSDLRVVQIGPPVINQIALSGGNVVIRFTTTDADDTISSFTLLGSAASNGTAAAVDTVTAGTFTQLGTGAFQVTTPEPTNHVKFYRLKHN